MPPEILPFSFGEKSRNAGQSVSISCAVVDGDKPITVLWTLNNVKVSPLMGITTVSLGNSGSILTIPAVTYEHIGTFTCVAENAAGIATFSSQLSVTGITFKNIDVSYLL